MCLPSLDIHDFCKKSIIIYYAVYVGVHVCVCVLQLIISGKSYCPWCMYQEKELNFDCVHTSSWYTGVQEQTESPS